MVYDIQDNGMTLGGEDQATLALLDETEQEELEEWAFMWSIVQQMMELEKEPA